MPQYGPEISGRGGVSEYDCDCPKLSEDRMSVGTLFVAMTVHVMSDFLIQLLVPRRTKTVPPLAGAMPEKVRPPTSPLLVDRELTVPP